MGCDFAVTRLFSNLLGGALFSDLLIRLPSLFRRTVVEDELNEELQFHLENQVQKYMQSGLTREEAMRRTRLAFGGVDKIKEDCREALGVTLVELLPGFASRAPHTSQIARLFCCGRGNSGAGCCSERCGIQHSECIGPSPCECAAGTESLPDRARKGSRSRESYLDYLDLRDRNRLRTLREPCHEG